MSRASGWFKAVAWAAVLALQGLGPSLALAQTWQEYRYPEAGFAVQFPAPPTMTNVTYHTLTGEAVPAQRYSVADDGVVYSVIVADFSKTKADGEAIMADAIKQLAQTGEIKVDTAERINSNYGHDLGLVGKDGSQTAAAVFFADGALYELVGKASNPNQGSARTARFQQTLVFTYRARPAAR
jgi:hypothetical protein